MPFWKPWILMMFKLNTQPALPPNETDSFFNTFYMCISPILPMGPTIMESDYEDIDAYE